MWLGLFCIYRRLLHFPFWLMLFRRKLSTSGFSQRRTKRLPFVIFRSCWRLFCTSFRVSYFNSITLDKVRKNDVPFCHAYGFAFALCKYLHRKDRPASGFNFLCYEVESASLRSHRAIIIVLFVSIFGYWHVKCLSRTCPMQTMQNKFRNHEKRKRLETNGVTTDEQQLQEVMRKRVSKVVPSVGVAYRGLLHKVRVCMCLTMRCVVLALFV